jgi:Uma2 family endonuclease
MSTVPVETDFVLGLEHAGSLMTPEEFDAIEAYDENYRYELIHGVLVVNPIPSAEETGPNEFLGYLLLDFRERAAGGAIVLDTLPQQYVRTPTGRRIADRLISANLGRIADPQADRPSIAVEFVSAGKRSRDRDYVDKKQEYGESGLREYWIIDRFRRTMTVVCYDGDAAQERVIQETESYASPLLPGFVVPLARILASADRRTA